MPPKSLIPTEELAVYESMMRDYLQTIEDTIEDEPRPIPSILYRDIGAYFHARGYDGKRETVSAVWNRITEKLEPEAEKHVRGLIELDPIDLKIAGILGVPTCRMTQVNFKSHAMEWHQMKSVYRVFVDTPRGYVPYDAAGGEPEGATEHFRTGFTWFITGPTLRGPTEPNAERTNEILNHSHTVVFR